MDWLIDNSALVLLAAMVVLISCFLGIFLRERKYARSMKRRHGDKK